MASQGDWLGSSLWICLVRMKCIGGVNLDYGVCHEKVNEVWMAKTLVLSKIQKALHAVRSLIPLLLQTVYEHMYTALHIYIYIILI